MEQLRTEAESVLMEKYAFPKWQEKIIVDAMLDFHAQQSKDFYKNENLDAKCDDACKFNCTKGNTQEAECLKDEQVQFTFDPPKEQKLKIPKIIEILWNLKGNDKFYFQAYGEDILKSLVKQEVEKDKWISVKDKLPHCWEAGHWDGLKSDEVLAEDFDGNYYLATCYSGKMDGSEFFDWYSKDDFSINQPIKQWMNIPL